MCHADRVILHALFNKKEEKKCIPQIAFKYKTKNE